MISRKTKLLLGAAGLLPSGAFLFYWEHYEAGGPTGIVWDIRSDGDFWTPELLMVLGGVALLFGFVSLINDLRTTKQ